MPGQIYAIKGNNADGWNKIIFDSLLAGEGRFGWSYMHDAAGTQLNDADLRRIDKQISELGWQNVSKDDRDRYVPFLLELKEDDWVVYINVPEWGKCTLARITGPYYWLQENSEDYDFNHRFRVDKDSVRAFDRNDRMVHPALSARLKLQGRYWRINAEPEFNFLVEALKQPFTPRARTVDDEVAFLKAEIENDLRSITTKIQRTHPNYGFERLLTRVFEKVPGVRSVIPQGGAGDNGADLIVQFESGLPLPAMSNISTCLVQAKSYVNEHSDLQAVRDIERAFVRYPAAEMGLIISTATSSSKELEAEIAKLRDKTGRRVELLIGLDVARFIIRFGGHLLGRGHMRVSQYDLNKYYQGAILRRPRIGWHLAFTHVVYLVK